MRMPAVKTASWFMRARLDSGAAGTKKEDRMSDPILLTHLKAVIADHGTLTRAEARSLMGLLSEAQTEIDRLQSELAKCAWHRAHEESDCEIERLQKDLAQIRLMFHEEILDDSKKKRR